MSYSITHGERVENIATQIKRCRNSRAPLTLRYGKGYSNTTRSQSYKQNCDIIDCSTLNHVVAIDSLVATVEPRVTMEELIRATLKQGLMPEVVPEFKGITVGGAILGSAAESTSHAFGTFGCSCESIHILSDEGEKMELSSKDSLFHALNGSYGSLGALTLATIRLKPAKKSVLLDVSTYKTFSEALDHLKNSTSDFVEGLIFSRNHFCVITGTYTDSMPTVTLQSGPWYFERVLHGMTNEVMDLEEYLFRYDLGAFWMGDYLFKPKLLTKFFVEGVWKMREGKNFSQKELTQFSKKTRLAPLKRFFAGKKMESQNLWALLHRAEKWVQNRFVIQDCCVPFSKAENFCAHLLENPALFPIWLCPIKATNREQIFAPHNSLESKVLNFGLYGLPAYAGSLEKITKKIEQMTYELQGRKVLYSKSYYTEEEFWKIYPKGQYESLRKIASPLNKWRGITEKVLSD